MRSTTTPMLKLVLLCGTILALASDAPAGEGLIVDRLRCEALVDPLGIDATEPRLSWIVTSGTRGQRQTAYRVLVAATPETLADDRGDLWDSGKVEGDRTAHVVYAGRPLPSRMHCFWKVKSWDKDGRESPWSRPGRWSMGLLRPRAWRAQWISYTDNEPLHANRASLYLPPARQYRKVFRADMPVRRATLYASALGIFDVHLNGGRVGDAMFAPGWSDYGRRAYYRTYDVTSMVKQGSNAIGAVVAEGWYSGYVGYGLLVGYGPNKAGRYFYGKTPAFVAQLEIEYEDGTIRTIGTDHSWKVSDRGPVREADIIMGESFDARLDRPDWCTVHFEDDDWDPAIPAGGNGETKAVFSDVTGDREVELGFRKPAVMQAYPAQPVRPLEEIKPLGMTEHKPGVWIYDLGQNFAGVARLKVKGPAGTRVQLRFGEMLHPDGRLMTENLRRARATDFYTLRGDAAGETWTPRFTYHGFRYVELSGLPTRPDADAVTGIVVGSDAPLVSTFECSDPVANQLFKNVVWTQRANFVEVPTDCPQRDERLGWMGDAQIYVRTATFNADVNAFFTKWLDDVEESQRSFSAYPDYAPYPMAHGQPRKTFGTAWTDAGIICPWTIWKVYGDARIIEHHYDSMSRFMDFRIATSPAGYKGVSLGNPWGDWLNLNEETPVEYVDVCYYAQSARMMADMAAAVGRARRRARYRTLFDDIKAAFGRDQLNPDGTLKVATQTAHVLALSFGLLPDDRIKPTADRLAAMTEKNGGRMATGFLGTKPLLPVLSEHGHHDLAVRLFQSREFPSWGYEVANGATSVWERWDSYTKEHGFDGITGKNNAAMNSFSHYAFGAVCEWMFRSLAGIDTDGEGYRKIVIRPGPPSRVGGASDVPPMSWVKASYDGPTGRISTAWKREGERFELDVTVPANTTAAVHLPANDAAGVTEGGKPLGEVAAVKVIRRAGDRLVLDVPSGSYRFASTIAGPDAKN